MKFSLIFNFTPHAWMKWEKSEKIAKISLFFFRLSWYRWRSLSQTTLFSTGKYLRRKKSRDVKHSLLDCKSKKKISNFDKNKQIIFHSVKLVERRRKQKQNFLFISKEKRNYYFTFYKARQRFKFLTKNDFPFSILSAFSENCDKKAASNTFSMSWIFNGSLGSRWCI